MSGGEGGTVLRAIWKRGAREQDRKKMRNRQKETPATSGAVLGAIVDNGNVWSRHAVVALRHHHDNHHQQQQLFPATCPLYLRRGADDGLQRNDHVRDGDERGRLPVRVSPL